MPHSSLRYGGLASSLLDSDTRIVEEDTARCTAEEGQGLYEAFEEGLGVLPAEAHGEGCAVVGKADAEEVHFHAFLPRSAYPYPRATYAPLPSRDAL